MSRALAALVAVAIAHASALATAKAGGPNLTDLSAIETSTASGFEPPTRIDWPLCTRARAMHAYNVDPFTGKTAFHAGLDLSGEFGLSVHAAAPGIVAVAARRGPYGLLVQIDHADGLVTRYAQLQMAAVEPGDRVEAGQMIARVGSTGRSTGPHLHFEVWLHDRQYDPLKMLTAKQQCGRRWLKLRQTIP